MRPPIPALRMRRCGKRSKRRSLTRAGTLGNNTLVLELIAELENAEKALIPLSTYTALRERLKQVLQMNEADYHPDDWNALMQLVEYANVLVAQETGGSGRCRVLCQIHRYPAGFHADGR